MAHRSTTGGSLGRLGALAFALCFAAAAGATSPYEGKVPVAGDDHRHPGSLIGNYLYHRFLQSAGTCNSVHSGGDPLEIYDAYKAAGFDWVLLSHHNHTMTGDPHGNGVGNTYGAYQWWTNPTSTPIPRTSSFGDLATPDPDGLPDYTDPGSAVVPGWNEALSFSTAADAANDPAAGFIAFAGREFTTSMGEAVACNPSQPSAPCNPAPNTGGHKVVLLSGSTDRICGPATTQRQGAANACDETDLYRWVRDEGGVIIQAHPGSWAAGMTPWHPVTARAGMTDVFVHGVEVSSLDNNIVWEAAYQIALGNGYRVFPSYGSDFHYMDAFVPGCAADGDVNLATGAVLCWIPAGTPSREAILDAMRARNCYYSRSHTVTFSFEARDATPDAPQPMGAQISSDGTVLVSVQAVNELANQAMASPRRFDRLEIVQVTSKTTFTPVLRYECDLAGSGVANNCCTLDATNGDHCDLVDQPVAGVGAGALYARVCQAGGSGGCTSTNTRVVGAPIFVNWSAYKTAQSLPTDTTCDFDSDGIPCWEDLCWITPSDNDNDADADGVGDECDVCPSVVDPAQADTDGDGQGDACQSNDSDVDGVKDSFDVCPLIVDAAQFDGDGDGDGNVCDNCISVSNATQADGDTDGAGDACDLCPSISDPAQVNSDSDAYGDACDNCDLTPNPDQADYDGDGYGNACDLDSDGDGVPDASDNCDLLANPPPQVDSNNDGVGDACDLDGDAVPIWGDNCPTVVNPDQYDSDFFVDFEDGVGDECDNCVYWFNPRVDPATQPPHRTFTGGQLDDDADGFGNACDGDFDGDGIVEGEPGGDDLEEIAASWTSGGPFPSTAARTCGTSGDQPCDRFDLFDPGLPPGIDDNDRNRFDFFSQWDNVPLRCADCGVDFAALPCVGDACIACKDGLDNDGDGAVDHPADAGCSSVSDIEESPDNDAVGDQVDNCLFVANGPAQGAANQCDTDQDGYGNTCDGDFDQDNVVLEETDFSKYFLPAYQGTKSFPAADMNCDGLVSTTDFSKYWLPQFKGPGKPGPSGLYCAGAVPCDL